MPDIKHFLKYIFLCSMFFCAVQAMAQDTWGGPFRIELSGSKKNQEKYVYLRYSSKGKFINDSTRFVNGVASLSGSVDEPVMATLILSKSPLNSANYTSSDKRNIVLEKSNYRISIKDSLKSSAVTGSPANADWEKLNAEVNIIQGKMTSRFKDGQAQLTKAAQTATSSLRDSLHNIMLEKDLPPVISKYVNSPAAVFILNREYSSFNDTTIVGPLFNKLSPQVRKMSAATYINFRLEMIRRSERLLGNLAPEFALPDTSGRKQSLSSFKGKYILIDFWASWCKPCREESPYLVRALERFNKNGFDVLSITLDREALKAKWIAAIKQDKMTWTQVIDTKSENGKMVADMYGILSIPQNFLVDPSGKIIAKNLRGEELLEYLNKLFG